MNQILSSQSRLVVSMKDTIEMESSLCYNICWRCPVWPVHNDPGLTGGRIDHQTAAYLATIKAKSALTVSIKFRIARDLDLPRRVIYIKIDP